MFWGVVNMLIGAFFLWMGAFQFVTAMLPKKYAMEVAEMHGSWMRENIFRLPPAGKNQNDQ